SSRVSTRSALISYRPFFSSSRHNSISAASSSTKRTRRQSLPFTMAAGALVIVLSVLPVLKSFLRRWRVYHQPVETQLLDHGLELPKLHRLLDVAIDPKLIT